MTTEEKKIERLKAENWNLFSWVPPANELSRAILWEYSRDNLALCESIEALRSEVADFFELASEAETAIATYSMLAKKSPVPGGRTYHTLQGANVNIESAFVSAFEKRKEKIEESVGRFDWHFLCASDFPKKLWQFTNKRCPIRMTGEVFKTPLQSASTDRRFVKHGRNKREKANRHGFYAPVYAINLLSYVRQGDLGALNEFQNELISNIASSIGQSDQNLYVFAIPEADFAVYDPEEIAASLRHQCHILGRRRIVPSSSGLTQRNNLRAYWKWLGASRFLTSFESSDKNRDDKKKLLATLQKLSQMHDRTISIPAERILKAIESKSLKEFARKADELKIQLFGAEA